MISLRKLIKLAPNSYVKRYVRYCSSNLSNANANVFEEGNKLSVRQHDWKLAQEKYAHHPLIIYSTKMEEQVEYMTYRRFKSYQYQQFMKEKRKMRELSKRPLIHEPEIVCDTNTEGGSNFPSNWMEEYEFFEGYREGSEQHSPYGTPDPQIWPSNVPCSGCGAHLHCTHITLPATCGTTRPIKAKAVIC